MGATQHLTQIIGHVKPMSIPRIDWATEMLVQASSFPLSSSLPDQVRALQKDGKFPAPPQTQYSLASSFDLTGGSTFTFMSTPSENTVNKVRCLGVTLQQSIKSLSALNGFLEPSGLGLSDRRPAIFQPAFFAIHSYKEDRPWMKQQGRNALTGHWCQVRSSRPGQSGEHLLHEQQRAVPGAHGALDAGLPQRRIQTGYQQGEPSRQQRGAGRGIWQPHGEAVHGDNIAALHHLLHKPRQQVLLLTQHPTCLLDRVK